jgi:AcrR family transcriptional regulator
MGRARSAEAKLARREQILAAAAELLRHEPYEELTMASVARAAGLAKGTPYLYWRSKEELFLTALQEEYLAFLRDLVPAVRAVPPTPEAIGTALVDELLGRERLVALIGQVHVALERNAPVEAVIAFKRALVAGGVEVAVALNERLPWLPIQDAARLLVRVHGALVALRQMADPPAPIRAALDLPDLAILRVDLAVDLRELVLDLLIAARARRGESR